MILFLYILLQSIFWHGVYGFVHRYTKASGRRVTLEDTLTGNSSFTFIHGGGGGGG